MSNEIETINAKLSSAPTTELRAELARGLTLTADTLTRLGAIWAELERRGEDLSDLRTGLARNLPLIAAGRLAAEAVVAFAGRPMLLRAIEGVDLARQRRFAAGELVEVIDPAEGATAPMPVASLPPAAIRLVFDRGEVRTPQAQRLALRQRRKKVKTREEDKQYRPHYDAETGLVKIGHISVRLGDLLTEIAGADLPAIIHKEEYVTVKVRLTQVESKKLVEVASKTGLPDWELARKAMRAFGMI